MRNVWMARLVGMALLLTAGTGSAAQEPTQGAEGQAEVASQEEAPAPTGSSEGDTTEPKADESTVTEDASSEDAKAEAEDAEQDAVSPEGTDGASVEPVDEAPGETNLSVLETEEDYVPSMGETSLVMGSLYAGTMAVLALPSFMQHGGNWMGAIHLGLAGCAAYFPKSMGWKLIGGATFTTWSAINFLMEAREVGGAGMYQANMAIALGVPLVIAGAYFGFEVWGDSAAEPEAAEPIVEPGSEPSEPSEAEEPEAPAMSLHWNLVPLGDGALTSLTLQF